jgi:hypothetical protein
MFEITDEFLQHVGYDTTNMSLIEKDRLKAEFTAEFNGRMSDRIVDELTEEQAEEFLDIQNNQERARRWLDEFHSDYRDRDEFKKLASVADNEDEAATFYAVALWLRDAVPKYGELIQQELIDYADELAELRKAAYDAIDNAEAA